MLVGSEKSVTMENQNKSLKQENTYLKKIIKSLQQDKEIYVAIINELRLRSQSYGNKSQQ